MSMASHNLESKVDVIEIVTDDFDKVGYTKADEADMAKQNKTRQFHVGFTFTASTTLPLLTPKSADSTSSPSFLLQPQH